MWKGGRVGIVRNKGLKKVDWEGEVRKGEGWESEEGGGREYDPTVGKPPSCRRIYLFRSWL